MECHELARNDREFDENFWDFIIEMNTAVD
jgi:hypothetical protein